MDPSWIVIIMWIGALVVAPFVALMIAPLDKSERPKLHDDGDW